jgi:Rad3-related DNA helicase
MGTHWIISAVFLNGKANERVDMPSCQAHNLSSPEDRLRTAMFSIIEWDDSPETDLVLIRAVDEGRREAARPGRLDAPASGETLVCFKSDAPSAENSAVLQTLSAHGKLLDGALLARVTLPKEASHDLPALAAHYGLKERGPGAPARALVAAELFDRLVAELKKKPLAALDEMRHLLAPTQHALRPLIEGAAKLALKGGFGARAKTLRDLLPAESGSRWITREPPKEPPSLLDVERVCGVFSRQGALAQGFAAYEHRPEQLRMVREVCDAFNEGLVVMVEAGTGTGKSLAYLVPAILWAGENRDPVVISTNTKNLQSQLFEKDLPFLEKALGGNFRCALIKGRPNYLCVRKLFMLLGAADRELSDAERVEILPVISWLAETESGDVAELSGLKGGMESELWARMATQRDECLGPRCRFARNCFVRRARARALQSDVVVANHSTVFWEAGIAGVALPPFRCIVFDEAHNLEDVATEAATIRVAPWQLSRVLNRLFRPQRDGAGRGLFASLLHQLSLAAKEFPAGQADRLAEAIRLSIEAFPEARRAAESLFGGLALLLDASGQQFERLRYDADRRPDDWPQLARSAQAFVEVVEPLAKALEELAKPCAEIADLKADREPFATLREVAVEVAAQASLLREMLEHLDKVLKASDEEAVYWIEREPGGAGASFNAAPLDIAALMERTIFSRVRTAVFTSATLTVAGNFDFMRDRLGMRGAVSTRLRVADLGTSFDFERQALLAVPSFLPEPRTEEPNFVRPFSALAVDILTATRGRGLVLFTSHAMLREAYPAMKSALARSGIRVMAQGVDGERSRLITRLSRESSSVLLGTQSFWEGVDVPGEALSCLIVAKLPFRVHTNPLVAARCEALARKGRSDFTDYMVPDAVIRLKQGFGRLIRTRADRGVVIVCDPRLVTRGYGKTFRDSLPARTRVFKDQVQLVGAVREFLKTG